MATDTKQTPRTVTRSQSFENLLVQLPPTERAVVEWNTSSPERLRRLAESAVVLPRRFGEGADLLVADVSPNLVLTFSETPDGYALLDMMNKAALKWKKFPPPVEATPEWPDSCRLDAPAAKNGKAHT